MIQHVNYKCCNFSFNLHDLAYCHMLCIRIHDINMVPCGVFPPLLEIWSDVLKSRSLLCLSCGFLYALVDPMHIPADGFTLFNSQ